MKKIILLLAFILMVAAQLYMPLRLVMDSEHILESGKEFKFLIAPVYPVTPVNGSYLSLTFYNTTFPTDSTTDWVQNEQVYVALKVDSAGFAIIDFVSKEIPTVNQDYVKAFVAYVINDSLYNVAIRYPFDRFYIEAPPKSDDRPMYPAFQQDSTTVTYALVTVKDGEAIVTDVMVNEVSIKNQYQ